MKRLITGIVIVAIACVCMTMANSFSPLASVILAAPRAAAIPADAPDNNKDVLAADKLLVAALNKSDKAAAGKLFDSIFSWTNSAGETIDRAKALASLPKPPIGDESGAKIFEYTYGQVGAVQVSSGKVYILRIWVKRAEGWRLLDYHEVTLPSGAGSPAERTTNDCQNPCKGVPYTPKDADEKDILTSWGQLETAVTNHQPQVWAQHFLDEFLVISSGRPDPLDKAGRMGILSKPGIGPAPAGLAADPVVRFIHFGDVVVMFAQANPYAGKPAHISRIWVKRDGKWLMAVSYQTTIQGAAPIVPPAS